MTCFICRTQQVSKLSEDLYGMELHKNNWFLSVVQRQGHSNLPQLFDSYLDWKKSFYVQTHLETQLISDSFQDFFHPNSIKKDLLDQDIFIKILNCLLYSFIHLETQHISGLFQEFFHTNSIKKDLLDQDIFIKILYCLLYSFILVYKVPKCYWIKSRQVVKKKAVFEADRVFVSHIGAPGDCRGKITCIDDLY